METVPASPIGPQRSLLHYTTPHPAPLVPLMRVITVKCEGTRLRTRGDGSGLLVYHRKDMKITFSANKIIWNSAHEEGLAEYRC